MMQLYLLGLLFFAVVFLSFWANASKVSTPRYAVGEPIIKYEKTACFGTCPVYQVKIWPDGKILYHGDDFAPVNGDKLMNLTEDKVNWILSEAERIGFYQMPNKHDANITDLPSTILTIQGKTVEARANIPERLVKFLEQIQLMIFSNLNKVNFGAT